MSNVTLELHKEQFFPQLFANELLSVTRVSATSFRFAAFLWHHCGAESAADRSGWSKRQWQNHLANPNNELYAIYCDNEPAGCCEISRAPRVMLDKGGIAQIVAIGLLPEFKGEGLGRDMLTRLVEKAFATGAARVRISSRATVPESVIKLFQSQGFRLISG